MTIRKILSGAIIAALFAGLTCAIMLFSAVPSKAASTVKSAPYQNRPGAVFPETRHEFGFVMEGSEIKHDFIVENHGGAPLVITKVRPD
jgi:hypothetical protein